MSAAVGTVLVTGPTGGLGRSATMAMARRPDGRRPDLLLVGRPGAALDAVADEARAAGATAHAIGCDLGRLADVRTAAATARDLVAQGAVGPLRALVGNAGVSGVDTDVASSDGYEVTFAVNYLAHAQLVGDLVGELVGPARVVLVGSNTYHSNLVRRLLAVPPADWRDPLELARPTPPGERSSLEAAGVAYSNSKLALLYYAHELQRRAPGGVAVVVFEPGFMPGTGLSRGQSPSVRRLLRGLQRMPGISSPVSSGPALASVVLDGRWAHLRDGAFVVKDREVGVEPFAVDPAREARLWEATAELLARA